MREADRTAEFIGLWTASARRIFSFILSIMPHWADAEEAFQETSRVLWEKFDEFQFGTDFTAWACRIAYYKTMDVRARNRRSPLVFSDAFIGAVEAEIAAQRESLDPRHEALLECLEKLSERDRRLVHLRYREGATTKSAARECGRSVDAVYKALNRIHEALFDCIQRTLAAEGHP